MTLDQEARLLKLLGDLLAEVRGLRADLRTPVQIPSGSCVGYGAVPPTQGWTCGNCHTFVPNGCTHHCPTRAVTK